MKMEYNCLCVKVSDTQYNMYYINQSAIEQLYSILSYQNELSVNGSPVDTAVWADRLNTLSAYRFSADYWALRIGSGDLSIHGSLLTVLMYNALALFMEQGLLDIRPANSDKGAIINSPMKALNKSVYYYGGYLKQIAYLTGNKHTDTPFYDIPITKETYSWFTDEITSYTYDTAIDIFKAAPPVIRNHSNNLNIVPDIKPGYIKTRPSVIQSFLSAYIGSRQAYTYHDKQDVSREFIIRFDDTLRPVIRPRKRMKVISRLYSIIKTQSDIYSQTSQTMALRHPRLITQSSAVLINKSKGFTSNQRVNIVKDLRAFNTSMKKALVHDFDKVFQRIGKYGRMDDMRLNINKRTVYNTGSSDMLTIQKAFGYFKSIFRNIRLEKLNNQIQIQNVLNLEKIARRKLLICHTLLNASKSGSGKQAGFQDTMRDYLRYADIIDLFNGGLTYNTHAVPVMIDSLRDWYGRFAKRIESKHDSNQASKIKSSSVLIDNKGLGINKTPQAMDDADTDIKAYKSLSASDSPDREYIGIIKEFLDLYDITENLIRTTISRYINPFDNGKSLSLKPNLDAYIEQALIKLGPSYDNLSILQDLELVLTNQIYKDIIIDSNRIIIDAIPSEPEDDWEPEGIDELLIPNEEYPYESIKKDILDFKTGRPKDPVKQIDDHTYIAKMPASSPIVTEWDIGRAYIDVEIYWLKYIINIFNRSWQSNIFKYGAMDMMSGINTMLEYMRLYAAFHVPGIAMKQCERAVALIRWYAEHVLLKHSQFIIHIEYGHWESKLYTGGLDCGPSVGCGTNVGCDPSVGCGTSVGCEHELMGFEVTPTYVLRNTGPHAILLLRNYVCIDSSIKFSLFLDGEADIYINNELVASLSSGCPDIQVFALKAGDIEFRLDFTGNEIKIGNIIINNTHAVDIKTEYKYEYGKANFGINEVLASVKRYYRVVQDNLEAFKQAHEGILGLNDLTNQLNDYIELHHLKQSKGKRRTIKRL